jgi:glyoxylate reductase
MRIVTTLELPEPVRALLRPLGEVVGPDGWEDALPEACALISLLTVRVDQALLERAPRLRIVANAVVGHDNVDVPACHARGIAVTNTPDVLTDATADLAIALMLAAVRRLPQAERSLRAGGFRGWGFWDYLGGDLHGATLGIFGMGRIGQATASRARAFGMRIQYTNRRPLPADVQESLGANFVDWETLLTTSDVLSLHAPATSETHHILDAEGLRRMKPGSYLVNTARGALVDEAALVEVLRDRHLAGAGLDVYEREPEVHPGLLELDNVVLLPHIGSATTATREAMATLAARNVREVLNGGDPITPVRPRG